MLEYMRKWKFKHPNPNDFFRVAERLVACNLTVPSVFVNTTKTIDYGI
jgi:hypothetical protein